MKNLKKISNIFIIIFFLSLVAFLLAIKNNWAFSYIIAKFFIFSMIATLLLMLLVSLMGLKASIESQGKKATIKEFLVTFILLLIVNIIGAKLKEGLGPVTILTSSLVLTLITFYRY